MTRRGLTILLATTVVVAAVLVLALHGGTSRAPSTANSPISSTIKPVPPKPVSPKVAGTHAESPTVAPSSSDNAGIPQGGGGDGDGDNHGGPSDGDGDV